MTLGRFYLSNYDHDIIFYTTKDESKFVCVCVCVSRAFEKGKPHRRG